jgi:pilin isopeptide linkage protein
MKKTTKRLTAILAALMAAATIGCSSAMPVFASTEVTADKVDSTVTNVQSVSSSNKKELKFQKDVVFLHDGTTPNATFTFTATPVDATSIGENEKSNGLKVYPGVLPADKTSLTGTVTFTSADAAGYWVKNTTDNKNYDLASKVVTIDFSGITFTKPGVYRYQVVESTTSDSDGVMTTDTRTYIVDVAVEVVTNGSAADTYEISYFKSVLSTATDTKVPIVFQNKFSENALIITKTVTGNQGDKSAEFSFTLNVAASTYLPANTTLTAYVKNTGDGSNVNVEELDPTKDDGSTISVPKTYTITVGSDSTFALKDGEELVIPGLFKDTVFTVAESSDTLDGHTATISSTNLTLATDADTHSATATIPATTDSCSVTVEFENNKQVAIDTGVILTVVPITIVGGMAAAGAITLIVKRKIQK